MEYWWEGSTSTAISPTSTSDFVGQHNKIGGINFGATLVHRENLSDRHFVHIYYMYWPRTEPRPLC